MLIFKKMSILTYILYNELRFSLLFYFFCGRGLNGRAGCRQTEVQTYKQTNRQTKNRQGARSANSGAYYIPVLTFDAACQPATSIARPTASLPLCPCNYVRGLVIDA